MHTVGPNMIGIVALANALVVVTEASLRISHTLPEIGLRFMHIHLTSKMPKYVWTFILMGAFSVVSAEPVHVVVSADPVQSRDEQNQAELASEWKRLVVGHTRRHQKRGAEQNGTVGGLCGVSHCGP